MNLELRASVVMKWMILSAIWIVLLVGLPAGLWPFIPATVVFWMIPRWWREWRWHREQKKYDAEFNRVVGF